MQELLKRYMSNAKIIKSSPGRAEHEYNKAYIENELLEWILED